MDIQPFEIHIEQGILDDLAERLAWTRWPDEIKDAGWDYGTNRAYLRSLTDYWRTGFDWRAEEQRLNAFAHFRASVDGFWLHFIHERGKGPKPLPLLLIHGWPDSFFRFHKLIPLLTDPASHGGCAEDAFDVVVPSLPGFGFSDKPTQRGMAASQIAALFHRLMTEGLGYERFAAHGGDWGSGITEALASAYPTSLVGIHLTDVPYRHLFTVSHEDLTPEEQAYLKAGLQ